MTGTTPPPPLIDTHAHVYKTDMPQTGTAWHRPPADATPEEYIATLDQAGVLFGVIAAASIYGDYNDYTLSAIRRLKRLRATVIVRPDIDPYALRQMKDDGVVGIRFQFRNVASPSEAFKSVLRAVDGGRTWIKVSGGFRLTSPAAAMAVVGKLLETVGPERLMWGSDWPFAAFEDRVTYASVLNDYYRYIPDSRIRNAIDRTALAFYFS